jgi:hypothetical protein
LRNLHPQNHPQLGEMKISRLTASTHSLRMVPFLYC